MKSLIKYIDENIVEKYIAESKALHQNVNIKENLVVNSPSWVSEKLVINKNFKNFNIDSLNDITELCPEIADVLNQYYEEHDMIYKFTYKVYNVDDEPHLFIKKENKTDLNDSPCDSKYGRDNWVTQLYGMDNWVYGLYKLKDKLGDYLLDNLFGFYAKWNFIDRSSRINNLGKTAHGFYTTFNGMMFNSSKEARKFIRENKLKSPNGKAVHPKSLREIFDIYEECEKRYQYNKKLFNVLEK